MRSSIPSSGQLDIIPDKENTMDIRAIAVRVVVTFVEGFLAVVVAAGTTDLDVSTLQAAAVGGLAAAASAAYNVARGFLDAQPAP